MDKLLKLKKTRDRIKELLKAKKSLEKELKELKKEYLKLNEELYLDGWSINKIAKAIKITNFNLLKTLNTS